MNPLRIGIFVMMFPQRSETFIVTKVLKLLDAGFDVQIFSLSESPHWDAFEILRGREDVLARIHVLPSARHLIDGSSQLVRAAVQHPSAFLRYLAHNWRTRHEAGAGFMKSTYLRSGFVGHELDILHIEFDAQGVGIADLKEYFGCRLLLSARGTFQMLSVLDTTPTAPAYLFKYADGYHFISRFLERNTRDLGLSPDIPTWLIEPAIDLSLFTPMPRTQSSVLRLISVGRLSWEKGYEFALDAVARVRAAGFDVHYRIYGAGPYSEPVRYAIRQLELTSCVELVGAVDRERMPAAYAEADIMIHAAFSEGFCNAVVEAQAMELPVVASDAGGLPENVEDGVTGYIVRRRDPIAMAARTIELARSPALRRNFGASGRARALRMFDLDRQAEAFVRLYRELIASRR